jgi:hypothetical protein
VLTQHHQCGDPLEQPWEIPVIENDVTARIYHIQQYFSSPPDGRWNEGYEAGLHFVTEGRTGIAYAHLHDDPVSADGYDSALAGHNDMDAARLDYHIHRESAVLAAAEARLLALVNQARAA